MGREGDPDLKVIIPTSITEIVVNCNEYTPACRYGLKVIVKNIERLADHAVRISRDCIDFQKPIKGKAFTAIQEMSDFALDVMSEDNLSVSVKPGKILFTVIPHLDTSNENVFDHEATAPRIVLETPNPCMGCLTEVEIILIIRPYFLLFIPVRSAVESI